MNQELYNAIQEEPEDLIPKARKQVKQVKQVSHNTRVQELVYSFLKGRNYPLLYIKAFDLENALLQAGYAGWSVDSKLSSIMEWARSKNCHPLAIIKILNKELKKINDHVKP